MFLGNKFKGKQSLGLKYFVCIKDGRQAWGRREVGSEGKR